MIDTMEVLYSPFNVKVHKETFINYLEVCIDRKGIVYYAVPSHQEFLIAFICKNMNISRDELENMCPREYYCDFIKWLTMMSGCVSVWNDFIIGEMNEVQKQTIKMLKNEGLYMGKI